jgi:hypothetical protein
VHVLELKRASLSSYTRFAIHCLLAILERVMAPFIGGLCRTGVDPVFVAKSASIATYSYSLFHHSLVTSNFDALIFHAAASLQLHSGLRHDTVATSDHRLIVSPYNEPLHLLDLRTLDIPCRLLAKAFTIFKPTRNDYATAPYTESFNWQAAVDLLRDLSEAEEYQWREQKFYVVSFRSCLFPSADGQRVHELDAHSHQEAMASGGLLKYWFGKKNENQQNLATCKAQYVCYTP